MIKTFFFALLVCFSSSRTDVSRKDISSHLFLDTYCEPSEKPDHCRCILETYDIDHDITEKTPKLVYTGRYVTKGCHEVPRQLYVDDVSALPVLEDQVPDQAIGGKRNLQSSCGFHINPIDIDPMYPGEEKAVDIIDTSKKGLSWELFYRGTTQVPDWIKIDEGHSAMVVCPTVDNIGNFLFVLRVKDTSNCSDSTLFSVTVEKEDDTDTKKDTFWFRSSEIIFAEVVAGLILTCLVAYVTYYCCKRHKLKNNAANMDNPVNAASYSIGMRRQCKEYCRGLCRYCCPSPPTDEGGLHIPPTGEQREVRNNENNTL